METAIATRKGPFSLFALVLREDAPDRWDLVVSAPWLDQNFEDAVDYLVGEIKSQLGADTLVNLSMIVPVDPSQASLQELNRAVQVEHGAIEVRDSLFLGVPIKQAFIITSQTLNAPALR